MEPAPAVASSSAEATGRRKPKSFALEGKDVGWMQVAEFVGRLHLRQLHLVAASAARHRHAPNQGPASTRGAALGKPVTLDVLHGNPAKSLYLRLGFRQTGQDADKIQMIWRPRRG